MNLTFPAVLPRYHRSGLSFVAQDGPRTVEFWMTATAFGERFGYTDQDVGKAISTFERNRNAIESVARSAYHGQRRTIVITAACFEEEAPLPQVMVSED
jgi:Protein of unknown function (DUF1488)